MPVTVTACAEGPLLVRGPVVVLDENGDEVPRHRATVALCRCGLSARAPWCDGSHKVAQSRTAGNGRRQPK
jgi:CDGSH-type Zn-finger protein